MNWKKRPRFAAVIAAILTTVVTCGLPAFGATTTLLASGLQGAQGSAIGPSGDLFVTESVTGRILRVDRQTGALSVYASGLPIGAFPGAGAVDLTFIGKTAYVLVTLVAPEVGGHDRVGIYRMDGLQTFTLIADIGAWSIANPPNADIFVQTGVQYAIETFRGGFLVTDGHHNRVLSVGTDGRIAEVRAFGNVVPTGLSVSGNSLFMAQAGPVPHLPETGRVVSFTPDAGQPVSLIASGAPLLTDVEFGRGRELYALSQGVFGGGSPGSPALPNTGALFEVNSDGTLTVIAGQLDRPTSVELIGTTAYVVTLGGQILEIDIQSTPPYGTTND
jgi:hypothetical protein